MVDNWHGPTTGIDQTKETYWMRMKEYFDANNTSGNVRTMRSLRSRWLVINTNCQKWAGVQVDVDEINPSGTNGTDRKFIAQGLYRDEGKKNKGSQILGKAFTLHHCFDVLRNEEKWKTRGKDVATLAATNATVKATIIDDDASSDEDDKKRSSTPQSVVNTRRNVLGKKAAKDMRGRKAGDDDIAKDMERMANARLEYNEDRKLARNLEAEAEVWRLALEESMAAAEERRLALEKVTNEEHQHLVEEERKLFFMDTSNMDGRQKEYIKPTRDEVLAKKRMWAANMNAPLAGYGGMGASAGVFGGGMGSMRALAGLRRRHGNHGQHGRNGIG